MRYRPGLLGSVFWFGIAFLIIFAVSDQNTFLSCDRKVDFCSLKRVSNLGFVTNKKLIPVSEIKYVKYEVKKAGEYSDNPNDYLGVVYMVPRNGDCTFEVVRKFSTSRDELEQSMRNLANDIIFLLHSDHNYFEISIKNL